MPLSSGEIAQMTASFSGMYNQQQAGSMMSSMMGPRNPAMAGEHYAGKAMNMGAMVGGPLAMGAASLAGLDPFSLAMKAGMGVGSMGSAAGIGMGIGAGALAFGGATAAAAVPAYMMNQGMMGAQQQQQLNSSLRSNFNFQNGPNQQGFSMGQMGQIGNTMRSMTHEFGSGGEVTGMSELTKLASNMGRMGMTDGVRDVKQFTSRFKEMVTTLKTMATELGTSLESAQELMVSMRSSGIFNKGDQLRMSTGIKGFAAAGNLSMSELSSMSNIGSQISRSVGGRGRQGAFGGMLALGQIGNAQQQGILSDEDIYNATGLTGAEGRQAMATSQMSQSANFLKSGRGRYMLASMAGKNGELDEMSVQSWMAGGMSTGDTKGMANSNLGKVGRANFIRNEGRLRGNVLERFGGLAMPMAYQQWLESRGHDPDNMDDRSMLAFQRFSGLGRDEAEASLKMVQNLPQLQKDMTSQMRNQSYMDKLGQQRKSQGIEGIQNRFAQAREQVQGALQNVGQRVFQEGSEQLEAFFNELAGTYQQVYSREAEATYHAAVRGDKQAAARLSQLTGIGGGRRPGFTSGLKGGGGNLFDSFKAGGSLGKGQSSAGLLMEGISGLSTGDLSAASNAFGYFTRGESMQSKFGRAGFSISEQALSSPDALQRRLSDIVGVGNGASSGLTSNLYGDRFKGTDGQGLANKVKSFYLNTKNAGNQLGGDDQMAALRAHLGSAADGMSNVQLAQFAMEGGRASGLNESAMSSLAANLQAPSANDGVYGSGFRSEAERNKAFGRAFSGGDKAADFMDKIKYSPAGLINSLYQGASGNAGREKALGALVTSHEGRLASQSLFGDDKEAMAKTIKSMESENVGLIAKRGHLDDQESARLKFNQGNLGAKAYADALRKNPGIKNGAIDADLVKRLAELGLTEEQAKDIYAGIGSTEGTMQKEAFTSLVNQQGQRSSGVMQGLKGSGLLLDRDSGVGMLNQQQALDARLQKAGLSAGGSKALQASAADIAAGAAKWKESQQALAMGPAGELRAAALADEAKALETSGFGRFDGMSDQDLKASQRESMGTDIGDHISQMRAGRSKTRRGLQRGNAGMLKSGLGMSLSREEMAAVQGMDQDTMESFVAKKLGVSAELVDKNIGDVQSLMQKAKGGDLKALDEVGKRFSSLQGNEEVQKAKKEKMQNDAAATDPSVSILKDIAGSLKNLTPAAIGTAVGEAVNEKNGEGGDGKDKK